jgi:hypothetical protein
MAHKFVLEVLKGAKAEVEGEAQLIGRLKKAGKLSGLLAKELGALAALSPAGLRAIRVYK